MLGSCDPPLKPAFRQVMKEGRNQGRWFYTCPKPSGKQCGFFLWEESAIGLQKRQNAGPSAAVTPSKPPTGTRLPGAVNQAATTPGRANALATTPGRFATRLGGLNPGLPEPGRSETPQSEVGSTMAGELLFSPTSTVFPMPGGRNQNPFGVRSISRDPVLISIEDSDDEADRSSRPGADTQLPALSTPTTKRKRPAGDQDISDLDSDDAQEFLEMTERVESASQEKQARPSQEQLDAQVGESPTTPSAGRNARTRRPGLLSLTTPKSKGVFGQNSQNTGFTGASETRNSFTGASETRNNSFTSASETRNNSFNSVPETRNNFAGASGSGSGANKRFKTVQGLAVSANTVTPSPIRTRDALATATSLGGGAPGDTTTITNPGNPLPLSSQNSDTATTPTKPDAAITAEILAVLAKQPISAAAREEVRSRLNLHALKAEGVLRARDSARQALKARNGRVAELQEQLAGLERVQQARMELLQRAASDWETLPAEQGGE